ncbi:MAG: hypothetical protein LBB91_10360 [Clostridiales bacterium]|nr:hypothetical protein [Clostridiales bacterium]
MYGSIVVNARQFQRSLQKHRLGFKLLVGEHCKNVSCLDPEILIDGFSDPSGNVPTPDLLTYVMIEQDCAWGVKVYIVLPDRCDSSGEVLKVADIASLDSYGFESDLFAGDDRRREGFFLRK